MVDVYDNAAGVSELMSRHSVISSLASGWRLVPEGMLPNALLEPSSSSNVVLLVNPENNIVHAKAPIGLATVCTM